MVTPYLGRLAAWDRGEASLRPRPRARFEPDPDDHSIIGHRDGGHEIEELEPNVEHRPDEETERIAGEGEPRPEPVTTSTFGSSPRDSTPPVHEPDLIADVTASDPADDTTGVPAAQRAEPRSLVGLRSQPHDDDRPVSTDAPPPNVVTPDGATVITTRSLRDVPMLRRRQALAALQPGASDAAPSRARSTASPSSEVTADVRRAGHRPEPATVSVLGDPERRDAWAHSVDDDPARFRGGSRQPGPDRSYGTRRRATPDTERAEPTVHVSIGRIQVRVQAPPTAKPSVSPTERSNHPRPSSLDDYLDDRVARRQR